MPEGRLLRILGVGFGVAVVVGNSIGSGIFRTPGEVAAAIPNAWAFLALWLAGGLYALVGSISIAELAAMTPRAGGQYVFARRALGPYAGFIVGWSDWLSTCGSTTAVALVVGEYLAALVPRLAGFETAIAVATAIVFALVQVRGSRWGSRAQQATTILKGAGFALLIGALFLLGGSGGGAGPAAEAAPAVPHGLALAGALVVALQSIVYTYDGWNGVTYFSEEVRDPGRDIPRSTFLGVGAVILIYVLLNAALLWVLPIERIAGSEFAPGLASEAVFGVRGGQIVRVLVVLSMLGGINAYTLMASRTLFGLSRDGLFARFAERVNEGGTPIPALAVSTAVAIVLMSRTFGQVIAVLAFFFVTNYLLSFVSVFVLRRREPDAPRPYRAWGYPFTTAFSLVGAAAFLVGAVLGDTTNSLIAVALLAASYPVYRLVRR